MKLKIPYKCSLYIKDEKFNMVFNKELHRYIDIISVYNYGQVRDHRLSCYIEFKCQGVAFLSIHKDLIDYINET